MLLFVCSLGNLKIAAAAEPKEAGYSGAEFKLLQILKDGVGGVYGLDNPRAVTVAADNSRVFVVSGDDNALAVFAADKHFTLSQNQVFKNTASGINGLEGASAAALINHGEQVLVTGFYDGALSVFSRRNNRYLLQETISDGLDYKLVFSGASLGDKDSLGLLGAWEVISSNDDKQILVAGYKSDAVSVFDVTADNNIIFNHFVKTGMPAAGGLGNPVSLALSPSNEELFVLGFEKHRLTVFDRDKEGKLSAKQVLQQGVAGVEHFLNPQKIVVSPDGQFLYVACSGSNALVVFRKGPNGRYAFLQAITDSGLGGGLKGAASLALSPDGTRFYAAGEGDTGLLIFETRIGGGLKLLGRLPEENSPIAELRGISSINVSQDGRYLLLTAAKDDALFVFKVMNTKHNRVNVCLKSPNCR
ncbi:beta-propeller fold lactonase family protein [Thalassomonas viridans]|uniref:Beta-propeller fold lactonase family protein n=1 Tax=Thalassomonas viridans TaxID=137584 RepID=A0AAE9Z9B9_9GAMM|nr:beta-propeller fold lactonase family protein [Thalassomonas viridans]WDE08514.1 beta-propeller fold lactonase family protein [Thalassomonas viridans]